MAKKKLTEIIDIARQILRAEFKLDESREWTKDELIIIAKQCLVEISKSSPRQVIETVKTTAASVQLDISSIEDLIAIQDVEYPVGNEPRDFRNFNVFGNTLTMEIDLSPAANEDVYLYCKKTHQLTDDTSTLPPQLEEILVKGITGYAAVNKSRWHIRRINVGGSKVAAQMQNWGLAQLAFYNQGLVGEEEPDMYVDLPRV